jgi:hypothetical protein
MNISTTNSCAGFVERSGRSRGGVAGLQLENLDVSKEIIYGGFIRRLSRWSILKIPRRL